MLFVRDMDGLVFNSQLVMFPVLSPDFDLGQVEHGLNDHRKLNVLLGLHSSLHVPFFSIPKMRFWSTELFQELTRFLLLLMLQELYFRCVTG